MRDIGFASPFLSRCEFHSMATSFASQRNTSKQLHLPLSSLRALLRSTHLLLLSMELAPRQCATTTTTTRRMRRSADPGSRRPPALPPRPWAAASLFFTMLFFLQQPAPASAFIVPVHVIFGATLTGESGYMVYGYMYVPLFLHGGRKKIEPPRHCWSCPSATSQISRIRAPGPAYLHSPPADPTPRISVSHPCPFPAHQSVLLRSRFLDEDRYGLVVNVLAAARVSIVPRRLFA